MKLREPGSRGIPVFIKFMLVCCCGFSSGSSHLVPAWIQVFQSKPRVVVSPGSPARITVGSDYGVQLELELSAGEAADGGFELATDLKRIE
jgi:hypothetical protein